MENKLLDIKELPFMELPDKWSSLSLKLAGGAGIELLKDCTARKIKA